MISRSISATFKRLSDPRPGHVYAAIVVLGLVYCAPLFSNLENQGRVDWDQFTTSYATPRIALLRDHQLPLWNPYAEGGTVLLAHPHSPVASPWYLLTLLLGAPLALRVQVLLFAILGGVGMAALVRKMTSSLPAMALGGCLYMMNSHFALHMAEGHIAWTPLGLMPWIGLFLVDHRWTARSIGWCALLWASILGSGSVYTPAIFIPVFTIWIALESLRNRDLRIAGWLIAILLAVSLIAFKLLPTAEFASAHPRSYGSESVPLAALPTLFAGRDQVELYQAKRDHRLKDELHHFQALDDEAQRKYMKSFRRLRLKRYGFHEFGSYITLLGVCLAAFGIVRSWSRHWPLFLAGFIAGCVAIGGSFPVVDLWQLLKKLPLYESLHVPSRAFAAVVFVLSLAAALGMSHLSDLLSRRSRLVSRGIPLLAIVIIVTDLGGIGWRLFSDAFVIPPAAPSTQSNEFVQAIPEGFASNPFPGVMYSYLYPYLLANVGNLNGYENMQVRSGEVKTVRDPDYRGEVYLEANRGTAKIRKWTMSRVGIEVDAENDDRLIMNQNYARGWRADRFHRSGLSDRVPAVASESGLVSVEVDPQIERVVLSYFPKSLVIGAGVSGVSLIVLSIMMIRPSRPRRDRVTD